MKENDTAERKREKKEMNKWDEMKEKVNRMKEKEGYENKRSHEKEKSKKRDWRINE